MMSVLQQRLGTTAKSVDSKGSSSKIGGGLLFIGCLFALLGGAIFGLSPSAEDYQKVGEYEFQFYQSNRVTSSSIRRINGVNRTSTTEVYQPLYLGYVGEDAYTYNYYIGFETEAEANAFTDVNQTLMVTAYLDEYNQLVFLASHMTLEEYFYSPLWMIFAGIGGVFVAIGVGMLVRKRPGRELD